MENQHFFDTDDNEPIIAFAGKKFELSGRASCKIISVTAEIFDQKLPTRSLRVLWSQTQDNNQWQIQCRLAVPFTKHLGLKLTLISETRQAEEFCFTLVLPKNQKPPC